MSAARSWPAPGELACTRGASSTEPGEHVGTWAVRALGVVGAVRQGVGCSWAGASRGSQALCTDNQPSSTPVSGS